MPTSNQLVVVIV